MKNNDMMYTSKRNIIIYLLSILLPSSLLNSLPSPFKRNKYLEFQKFIIFLLFFSAFHVCIKIAYNLSFVFWIVYEHDTYFVYSFVACFLQTKEYSYNLYLHTAMWLQIHSISLL